MTEEQRVHQLEQRRSQVIDMWRRKKETGALAIDTIRKIEKIDEQIVMAIRVRGENKMSTVSGLDIANQIEREWRDRLEAAVKAAVAAEREACAKLASEPQYWPLQNFTHAPSERTMGRIEGEKEMSRQIAAAIRARSSNAP